jgi:hypothetical protein
MRRLIAAPPMPASVDVATVALVGAVIDRTHTRPPNWSLRVTLPPVAPESAKEYSPWAGTALASATSNP